MCGIVDAVVSKTIFSVRIVSSSLTIRKKKKKKKDIGISVLPRNKMAFSNLYFTLSLYWTHVYSFYRAYS